jgi:hypothetical protein
VHSELSDRLPEMPGSAGGIESEHQVQVHAGVESLIKAADGQQGLPFHKE